ncbi:MAG: TlpA family protein disulfide reductase [Actinobacteria bacterium]|nr:TlpA family protein disulfide reductase [Actinomycetota bacterium]
MFKKGFLLLAVSGFLIAFLLLGCGSLSRLVGNLGTGGVEEISETGEPGETASEESTKETTVSKETASPGVEESKASETQQEKPKYNSPDFTLESLTGEKMTLSEFAGHVVVLNFWATWCPPCREEMPDFQTTWEKYKGKDVVFLGVSIDQNRSDVETFIKDYNVTYTILLDLSSEVANLYGITAIPTTFVLDVDGTVLFRQVGAMTADQLSAQINGALK